MSFGKDDPVSPRVLDVGAWDGDWTFAALKRGAREVVIGLTSMGVAAKGQNIANLLAIPAEEKVRALVRLQVARGTRTAKLRHDPVTACIDTHHSPG